MSYKNHNDRLLLRKHLFTTLLRTRGRFHGQLVDLANLTDDEVEAELNRRGLNPPWLLNEFVQGIDTIDNRVELFICANDILQGILQMDDEEVERELEKEGLDITRIVDTALSVAPGINATDIFLDSRPKTCIEEIISMTDEDVDEQLNQLDLDPTSITEEIKEHNQRS